MNQQQNLLERIGVATALLSSSLSALWKLTLLLGAIVLYVYCRQIFFLPTDITAGATLLLAFIAMAFSMVYLLATGLLAAFSYFAWHYIWRLFGKILPHLRARWGKPPERAPFPAARPDFSLIPALLLAVIVFVGLWLTPGVDRLQLVAMTMTMSLSIEFVLMLQWKLQNSTIALDSKRASPDEPKFSRENARAVQGILVAIIVLSPLIFGGLLDLFSSGSMRLTGLRMDGVALYAATDECKRVFGDDWKESTSEESNSDMRSFAGMQRCGELDVLWHRFGETQVLRVGESTLEIELGRHVLVTREGQVIDRR